MPSFFFKTTRPPPTSPLFPNPPLFRSGQAYVVGEDAYVVVLKKHEPADMDEFERSEEHTSELQSRLHLLCPPFFLKPPAPHRHLPSSPTRRSSDRGKRTSSAKTPTWSC